MEAKSEGIVLKNLEYKERDRIVSLFTPGGLLSLIIPNISSIKSHLLCLTSPLARIEFIYVQGKNDLHRFRDGTLLTAPVQVNQSMAHLKTATTILKALSKTQLPDKRAETLYILTCAYLRQIPNYQYPLSLLSSFLLKLMYHEGVLEHNLAHWPSITPEDFSFIEILAAAKHFKEIDIPHHDKTIHEKIEAHFWSQF